LGAADPLESPAGERIAQSGLRARNPAIGESESFLTDKTVK